MQQQETPRGYYFDFLEPAYDKLKWILVTGGEPLFAANCYDYLRFMSEKHPSINIKIESNGIAFNEKIRQVCADGLMSSHFSLNASNAEVFCKGCWSGENGEVAFNTIINNIKKYIELLEQKNMLCFAPDYSMVVNKDNYYDVYDFVKMALELKAYAITFFFDYSENNMSSNRFTHTSSREALKVMLELERILAKKVYINFRLWIPSEELAPMQELVDNIPYEELASKYAEILKLAEGRNVEAEHAERNRLRREHGKKEMTFDDDYSATLHMRDVGGKQVCSAPWEMLDLYPDGRLDFCGWFLETLNINEFVENGKINVMDVINSPQYMILRNHFLHGNYRGCQECCPMNDVLSPIVDLYASGAKREKR